MDVKLENFKCLLRQHVLLLFMIYLVITKFWGKNFNHLVSMKTWRFSRIEFGINFGGRYLRAIDVRILLRLERKMYYLFYNACKYISRDYCFKVLDKTINYALISSFNQKFVFHADYCFFKTETLHHIEYIHLQKCWINNMMW